MSTELDAIRDHYDAGGLIDGLPAALATIDPEGQPLLSPQLAPLDQFHTRGLAATAELAGAVK